MPEKLDPRQLDGDGEYGGHAGDQTPECAARRRALRQDREDEHAQQRPVHERSVSIDDLDERALVRRAHRHHAGEQAPEHRRDLRYEQVVRVGRRLHEVAAVEIEDGRRGQRVQLAAARRHRRGEDRGNHQADEADRHPRRDERREHVVDVVVVMVAGGLLDDPDRLRAHVLQARVAREKRLTIVAGRRLASGRDLRVKRVLERGVLAPMRARGHLRIVRAVEQHRRRLEQVEDEHEHAARQNQQLQRNLDVGAHHQRVPRLVDRLRSQVALDLALIAAEVPQHQEQAAQNARPERVLLAQVEAEIERVQPAGGARQVQRLSEAGVLQDAVEQDHDRRGHAEDDDEHLLDVGPRHGLHTADRRVGNHRDADDEHGDRQRPAEDRRHHDRRRRERDPERRRAADEKHEARERAHPDVEAPLEVLVRGVDAGTREERHDRERQDHHRERQAEIELHEAQAGEVRLAGRPDDRDGAHLRRHHRQPDRPPRQRSVREEVAVDFVGPLRSAQAVDDDPPDVGDDDQPGKRTHRVDG